MDAPAVGVCGFGRCGSTMVMTMLDAGGCPPVEGSQSGSYEVDSPDLAQLSPDALAGRSVKLLDAVQNVGLPAARSWRFVWIDRDPFEQARSAVKFVRSIAGIPLADDAVGPLAVSYQRDRPAALAALHRRGQVVVLRYERVLANPQKAAKRLRLVWPDLDVVAAAAVVHQRDGACRPDVAIEEALSR